MKLRWIFPTLATCCLAVLAACGPRSTGLTITGSSTMAPLIAEVAMSFEAESGQRVDVQSGGSGRGIHDVLNGLAQIGMSSRALTGEEEAAGLIAHTVAWDGIVLIVNRANPVSELTRQQVRAIYRGEVDKWQMPGGTDQPITVVNKAEGRSTLTLFLEHFGLDNSEVKADLVAGENQQVILSVAGNPGAIGYVSIGAAEEAVNDGTALKLLPLEGVEASVENVQNGRYPLRRPLNLVTKGEPSPLARQFIDMTQSRATNAVVKAHHFVPVSP